MTIRSSFNNASITLKKYSSHEISMDYIVDKNPHNVTDLGLKHNRIFVKEAFIKEILAAGITAEDLAETAKPNQKEIVAALPVGALFEIDGVRVSKVDEKTYYSVKHPDLGSYNLGQVVNDCSDDDLNIIFPKN